MGLHAVRSGVEGPCRVITKILAWPTILPTAGNVFRCRRPNKWVYSPTCHVFASLSLCLPLPLPSMSSEKQMQDSKIEEAGSDGSSQIIDPEEERKLVRKIDGRILPITCLLYLFACASRSSALPLPTVARSRPLQPWKRAAPRAPKGHT